MVKKKVCKKCRAFVDGSQCEICKSTVFSTSWQGRITVVNAEKSQIADKVGIEKEGDYCIKVR
ncbi:DNA-directed RNA polymerase subunit E'' [Candidatus Woesearchaeota archaeon]|nr:DNA-directed RNA polymerase subunit E'' [Candidatus Woesearchaeota archaeon]